MIQLTGTINGSKFCRSSYAQEEELHSAVHCQAGADLNFGLH